MEDSLERTLFGHNFLARTSAPAGSSSISLTCIDFSRTSFAAQVYYDALKALLVDPQQP
jgi:hypothetical protein